MLNWIFGKVTKNVVNIRTHDRAAGYLEFEKARVRWFLSINSEMLPKSVKERGLTTYRSITIDNEELEFSKGFKDLHTKVYTKILENKGYEISDARPSIEIAYNVR